MEMKSRKRLADNYAHKADDEVQIEIDQNQKDESYCNLALILMIICPLISLAKFEWFFLVFNSENTNEEHLCLLVSFIIGILMDVLLYIELFFLQQNLSLTKSIYDSPILKSITFLLGSVSLYFIFSIILGCKRLGCFKDIMKSIASDHIYDDVIPKEDVDSDELAILDAIFEN